VRDLALHVLVVAQAAKNIGAGRHVVQHASSAEVAQVKAEDASNISAHAVERTDGRPADAGDVSVQ
jgi:hypothetical protein